MISSLLVESICKSLSPIALKVFKNNYFGKSTTDYTDGEALLLFLYDWFTEIKLLKPQQLDLVIQEFRTDIENYGETLVKAIDAQHGSLKALPLCKIGFLDRALVCFDGKDIFLNIKTGEVTATTDKRPTETISYSLTSIYLHYMAEIKALRNANTKSR